MSVSAESSLRSRGIQGSGWCAAGFHHWLNHFPEDAQGPSWRTRAKSRLLLWHLETKSAEVWEPQPLSQEVSQTTQWHLHLVGRESGRNSGLSLVWCPSLRVTRPRVALTGLAEEGRAAQAGCLPRSSVEKRGTVHGGQG